MVSPNIVVPHLDKAEKASLDAMMDSCIPLRIHCPECNKIFVVFIKDFNQGLHCLLGQACPMCKRFIKESDDPDELLVDAKEIRSYLQSKKEGETYE